MEKKKKKNSTAVYQMQYSTVEDRQDRQADRRGNRTIEPKIHPEKDARMQESKRGAIKRMRKY